MARKFSEEFKSDAIRLVIETGISARQASKELGIGQSTLEKWVNQYRATHQDASAKGNESEELKRLKAENHKLKLERELLKKAAVFFANDRSD
jgi:transposase